MATAVKPAKRLPRFRSWATRRAWKKLEASLGKHNETRRVITEKLGIKFGYNT